MASSRKYSQRPGIRHAVQRHEGGRLSMLIAGKGEKLRSNPFRDPFVEAGYLRRSLRAIAHQQQSGTYRPSLEIRDYRDGSGDLLYQCVFRELFPNADAAIDWAMRKGQQVVDDWAEPMNPGARALLSLPLH